MTDPYRAAAHLRCLICKDVESDGHGLRCPHDWALRPVDPASRQEVLRRAVDHQIHPRTCPACSKRMQIRRWSGVAGDDIDDYRQLTG